MAVKRSPKALPQELSKKVQVPMHPELHRALKIHSLQEGYETLAEWMHQHFCYFLHKEDLMLQAPETEESACA